MKQILRFYFFGLAGILIAFSVQAQERVQNVRVRMIDTEQLEILYDLTEIHAGDSVYVQVESRTRGILPVLPEHLRGDLGKQVMAGTNRRVVWNAIANGYTLNDSIRATVLLKAAPVVKAIQPQTTSSIESKTVLSSSEPIADQPAQRTVLENQYVEKEQEVPEIHKTRYVGPGWALLSAVAPGVGNIFVQTPKPKIGLRPLLTVGCYGLLAYGLSERQKAQDQYAIYEQQKNRTAAEPYYQKANQHHQTYFLMTRGAIVVAAADVVLTFIRGIRNEKRQRAQQNQSAVSVWPGIQAGQPTAILRYAF